jgi:hypothetical protein
MLKLQGKFIALCEISKETGVSASQFIAGNEESG